MTKNRFSSEMKQEQISRQQLAERFIEFGWAPTPNSIDLGEDFIVHIHLQASATGIVFHIQEKSVTNLTQRQREGNLPYSLKIKDLLHWENFLLPVVLIIWDIRLRLGKWALVKDLIVELDKNSPEWREKKGTSSISVRIPWSNTTDDNGLNKLRRSIGKIVYPIISQGKVLRAEIKLSNKAIEKFIKEGEPVTLSGENFETSFPNWWTKWFGDFESKNAEIEFGTLPKSYKAIIEFINKDNSAVEAASLEFRLLRAGTEILRFNNEHEQNPLRCNLNLNIKPNGVVGEATFSINSKRVSVIEIKKALSFLQAIKNGGRINFSFKETGDQFSFDLQSNQMDELNHEFIELIEKLFIIQSKTGKFISISNKGISNHHIEIINELYEILTTGRVKLKDMVVSLNFKGETLRRLCNIHKEGKPAPKFRITMPESSTELFGVKFETGPTKQIFQGSIAMSPNEFDKKIKNLSQEDFLSVEFVNVDIDKEFLNFSK